MGSPALTGSSYGYRGPCARHHDAALSPLSVEALAGGSAVTDGAAASIATKSKLGIYPNCAITSFVIDDHGRLGEDAIRRLHQSLGGTLQRCAADAVTAATTARPRV